MKTLLNKNKTSSTASYSFQNLNFNAELCFFGTPCMCNIVSESLMNNRSIPMVGIENHWQGPQTASYIYSSYMYDNKYKTTQL